MISQIEEPSLSRPAKSSALLDEQAVRDFHEKGWCVVDSVYDSAQLAAMEVFFEEFKHQEHARFHYDLSYEEVDIAKVQLRAMHPHHHSKEARNWALDPKVLEILGALLGSPALLAQTMYYFKPPGAKGQGMHQDNFYLLAAPATCIAAWTPIDDATLENGCLWVVPGSHRHKIHCPENVPDTKWLDYGDSHINPFPRDAKPVPVEVPRGSTMFFGGQLIHGSGPNRSKDRFRRTFIGHYVDTATESLSKFYHPVLNADGEAVSTIEVNQGGGPCGDGFLGAVH